MRVSALYGHTGPLAGQDVYVVGLGPSMSVFPISLLHGRTCVLLNDAQKFFMLGPVAIANHKSFLEPLNPLISWPIVKGRLKSDPYFENSDNHVSWDDPTRYVFSYRDRPDDVPVSTDPRALWREPDFYWAGPIAVYACQFLLQARVRSITLVGCDGMALGGEDYFTGEIEASRKATSKGGNTWSVKHNYPAYSRNLLVMRKEAEEKFGVPIVSLTPFVGLGDPAGQLKAIRAGLVNPNGGPPPRKLTVHERTLIRRAQARMRTDGRRAARG